MLATQRRAGGGSARSTPPALSVRTSTASAQGESGGGAEARSSRAQPGRAASDAASASAAARTNARLTPAAVPLDADDGVAREAGHAARRQALPEHGESHDAAAVDHEIPRRRAPQHAVVEAV